MLKKTWWHKNSVSDKNIYNQIIRIEGDIHKFYYESVFLYFSAKGSYTNYRQYF